MVTTLALLHFLVRPFRLELNRSVVDLIVLDKLAVVLILLVLSSCEG